MRGLRIIAAIALGSAAAFSLSGCGEAEAAKVAARMAAISPASYGRLLYDSGAKYGDGGAWEKTLVASPDAYTDIKASVAGLPDCREEPQYAVSPTAWQRFEIPPGKTIGSYQVTDCYETDFIVSIYESPPFAYKGEKFLSGASVYVAYAPERGR